MNTKYLFTLAAGSMLLFASCEKKGSEAYRIDGNHITFNVSADTPTADDKQAFNGINKCIFFTAGDSVYINGTACAVRPMGSSAIPSITSEYSPLAQMTTTRSDDDSYEFVYPTKRMNMAAGKWQTELPYFQYAISENNTSNIDISSKPDQYTAFSYPVWPLYFSTQNIANERTTIMLKNTCAFLNVRLRLGPDFFNAKLLDVIQSRHDPNFYFYSAPTITPADAGITTSFPIIGPCFIDCTDPENPSLVFDSAAWDPAYRVNMVYSGPADYPNTVCIDNSRPDTRHITNSLGLLSIPTYDNNDNKEFQVTMLAYMDLGQDASALVMIQTPTKSTNAPIKRNHLYNLEINMMDSTSNTTVALLSISNTGNYGSKEARMQLLRSADLSDNSAPLYR